MTLDIVQFATAKNDTGGPSSTTVTLAGCTPGNLLVYFAYIGNDNPGLTFPTGFVTHEEIAQGEGRTALATRTVPSSPPSTWQFTHGTFPTFGCLMELPPAAFDVDANSRSLFVNPDPPAVTPTAGQDAIVLVVGAWLPGHGITSGPSGYTHVADDFLSGTSSRTFVYKKLINPTSGAENPGTLVPGGSVQTSMITAAYIAAGGGGGGSTARSFGSFVG